MIGIANKKLKKIIIIMSRVSLKVLEDFFKTSKLNDDPIMLNKGTIILNQKKFVDSNLMLLKANTGKKIMMPYYDRLVQLYEILKQK